MLIEYIKLTKPKITQMTILSFIIGRIIFQNKLILSKKLIISILGIYIITSISFIINCIIERKIDKKMSRTKKRLTTNKNFLKFKIFFFLFILIIIGIYILYKYINIYITIITLFNFLYYSIIYTIFIKKYTVQNIVIGGLSGALTPIIGCFSLSNNIFSIKNFILPLIIFFWTPPHFWSLSLYNYKDYIKNKLPMLPIIYGLNFTKYNIYIYIKILFFIINLFFLIKIKFIIIINLFILNLYFLYYLLIINNYYSNNIINYMFIFSIKYIFLIFLIILINYLL